MKEEDIIEQTVKYVKQELKGAETGHDWWHIQRVWNNTNYILGSEKADRFVCQLAALLHDIADSKFHDGDEEIGPSKAAAFLERLEVPKDVVQHVKNIIQNMSYSSVLGTITFNSRELDIVQDADRLDALGAIGIARAFNYGGHKNREIYNPNIRFEDNTDKEAYKNSHAPTIHHFYDKLLKLKDKMNTPTGRALAQKRHIYLEQFLDQFFDEWDART